MTPEKPKLLYRRKTGEEKCSVCDKVLKENEVIPKLEHKYENGKKCVNCKQNAKKRAFSLFIYNNRKQFR
ncbi:MAG: hypothetical protein ACLUR5_05070 [Eubacterium ventriosum]